MVNVGRIELVIIGMICLIPTVLLLAGVAFAWAMRRDRMPCPYCAERIRKDARVCRFCGREVRSAGGGVREPGER